MEQDVEGNTQCVCIGYSVEKEGGKKNQHHAAADTAAILSDIWIFI